MTQRSKSIYSLLLALTLLVAMFAPAAGAEPTAAVTDIEAYVEAMQPGWNLGNTFDATGGDETAWGNPTVTQAFIDEIAAQGYKSIRIPITWDHRIGSAPNYTIDPAFLDRIEEVVDWALDANLYVMINMHHDSWLWVNQMDTDPSNVLARYNAGWTQIADHFKHHSTNLMFESINEPRFTDGWGSVTPEHFELLYQLNTSFHQIVRASGGNNDVRPLVLPTVETATAQENLDELYDTIVQLNDPNLIATVHYYGFWPFSVNIAGYTHFEDDTRNDIIQTFDRVYDTFTANGIPVILGEYGLLGFDKHTGVIEQGEKLKFFEFLIHYVQDKQITHMVWDNGQHFNRTSYEWNDPELYEMMQASWDGRSATAETDLIHLQRSSMASDVSVALNLNGNQLVSLSVNGISLQSGTDYELNGNILTFKSDLLSSWSNSTQLGTNAVITAAFDSGADWRFRVVVHVPPVMQDTTGTTEEFAIPTSFHGDSLATMEAVYADGSIAGPQNWTSYKEFGYAFSPSYASNEIEVLPEFFNEVQDGEVHLTFHFWSGEIVTYTITKSGSNVVGVASDDNPDPTPTGDLTVQYKAADTNATDNQIKPYFNIINNGTSAVELSDLKLRYYFSKDSSAEVNSWIDWAAIGGANIHRTVTDSYVELSFCINAGSIPAGGQSGDIQLRMAKSDWSNFDESNDYSFDPAKTSFADWEQVTLYHNDQLIWGMEP